MSKRAEAPQNGDCATIQSEALSSRERQMRGLRPWQPGQSDNPKGRRKGSRHKLGEDFLAAMVADFEQHGPATIAKVCEERPADYLKIVASILPKELNVRTDPLEELSDDDLEAAIVILQAMIASPAEGDEPRASGAPERDGDADQEIGERPGDHRLWPDPRRAALFH